MPNDRIGPSKHRQAEYHYTTKHGFGQSVLKKLTFFYKKAVFAIANPFLLCYNAMRYVKKLTEEVQCNENSYSARI